MSEIENHADFSQVRYSQVWEDADILCEALSNKVDGRFLSIASAGDNALALLINAKKVVALDLNATQIYCLELRVAAINVLTHSEFLQLMGARECENRNLLFERLSPFLKSECKQFWLQQPNVNSLGYGRIGKFEHYFSLFRRWVLPLVHSKMTIQLLLEEKSPQQRIDFYDNVWNTWRWRLLFKLFFSRRVMGKLGRDPAFFKYVEGSVAAPLLERAASAVRTLEPNKNPYLQWILKGRYDTALPMAWRAEHFDKLKRNIDNIEWHTASIESYLATNSEPFDGFNLSNIFEYMSLDAYEALLKNVASHAASGARLVYWNMLAPRTRPESLADQLEPLTELPAKLFQQDKAFFYSRLVIEQKI